MSAWSWPQWAIVGMIVLSAVVGILKDGEPRRYNAGYGIADAVIFAWILWMGGFWS